MNSLSSIIQRYRTLFTHCIHELPIVMLMPHSSCNCRCVMCDIWKGNKNLKQLNESDITELLSSLKKFKTKLVVMSGGEALLHENFFALSSILQRNNIQVHLLSTGLTLAHHAENILKYVDEVIISIDGPEEIHNKIRNIPNAYKKLKEGVQKLKSNNPRFRITGRSVIQKQNFNVLDETIKAAVEIGLDQISFLPADVSSHAFNREELWDEHRQDDVRISKSQLPEFKNAIEKVIVHHQKDFKNNFIAESPSKFRKIYSYYSAIHGMNDYPEKLCNAPWVSTVIEADGTVRPCFFHGGLGNISTQSLNQILNSSKAINFRKSLDTRKMKLAKSVYAI